MRHGAVEWIVFVVCGALCALGALGALGARAQDSPAPPPDSPRTSRIQGTATLGRNRPVPGATVVIESASGSKQIYLTSTDAKGNYRVESLAEGTYDVSFTRDGLAPITKTGIVVKPPFRGIVEVVMTPVAGPRPAPAESSAGRDATATVKLAGVAVDSTSKPVSDVKIRMVRASGAADPREVTTAADGSFSIDALAPGRWVVESLGLAYLPVRTELSLTNDATVQLVLVGQPASYQAPAIDLVPREEPIPPLEDEPAPAASAGAAS